MGKINIAIDGVSSSGKSTMAKDLAKIIGYIYIDSGAMYRAVTLYCLQNGLINDAKTIDEKKLKEQLPSIHIHFELDTETGRPITHLNNKNVEAEIRGMEVSSLVSPVSAIGFLRKEMVKQQQEMSLKKGVVMDGRDIGEIVLPDADFKFFLTAEIGERARRRTEEYKQAGYSVTTDFIQDDLNRRDQSDSQRPVGALKILGDSIVIDTTDLTIEEVLNKMLAIIRGE